MTFDDAMESTVTKGEAKREIRLHHCDWAEFVTEYGDHDEYSGETVLIWLGY